MARPFLVATLLSLAMPAAPLLAADPPAPKAVLATYADIALAMYGDALGKAQNLDAAVDALVQTPTDATLAAAREAWLAARVPYQQTEVFRFGNPIVDEWEGRVNAWPLDEGLIDYVAVATYGDSSDENAFYAANVIANPEAHHRRQGPSMPAPSMRRFWARCTRSTRSRPMSAGAITPSSSCSGART